MEKQNGNEVRETGNGVEAVVDSYNEIMEPRDCTVFLLNDDFTTKEFVVEVLTAIFHKGTEEATVLMETVHMQGKAAVGVYARDIAVTLAALTVKTARENGFPLRCELEEL
ncbi:ATP-dependent Clp protease adaptor ClpS [Treponema brennaborense]|uniref:ATP-dependent Clp protease adapter protein ClpS n=1 Tax=Treponema brennaborense (strain DSM 12168 / CIP 105900 / DD5/3) TaxID=906968 RepID=F4LP74_TREBD|nr:ATP-dependent Clp protease adaptor ClpS [Treponema brennaborense]AEE15950.1 ATP-dependent Clp protease adapter protein clpS [Treponema brennaborense DSM 12168]